MKIKIPFEFGDMEVEAETKEELEQAIEVAIRSVKKLEREREDSTISERMRYLTYRMKSKTYSVIEMIRDLIERGYFNVPRSMRDIKMELIRRGWHPRTSSLSPALIRTVKRGELERERDTVRKIWVYYLPRYKSLKRGDKND